MQTREELSYIAVQTNCSAATTSTSSFLCQTNGIFSHFVFIFAHFHFSPPRLLLSVFPFWPLISSLSPLPLPDAPCGSPSTWEKPHTSPDKVTNPSHFTAPSHCSPECSKLCVRVWVCGVRCAWWVTGGSMSHEFKVFFCCNKQLRQLWGLLSSDWLEK